MDYDSDMLEKVRDECGDFLKSLELNLVELHENAPTDMNEGLGEATSDVIVRELGPISLKSGLDKTADKAA